MLDPRDRHPMQTTRRRQVVLGEPGGIAELPDPGPKRDQIRLVDSGILRAGCGACMRPTLANMPPEPPCVCHHSDAKIVERGGSQLHAWSLQDCDRDAYDGNERAAGPTKDEMTWPRRAIRTVAWSTKAKFTAGSAVLLFDSEDSILLVKSRLHDRGEWGLPGGFQRLRETSRQTAIRETREETGLQLVASELSLLARCRQTWAATSTPSTFTASAKRRQPTSGVPSKSQTLRGTRRTTCRGLP